MSYSLIKNMADKNKLPNCVLFYGNEEYLMDYSVKYIKYRYIDENYEDMNYVVFEKPANLNDYFEFANTFPFMSEKKLCIIKEAGFFTSTGSLDKKEEEKLLKYIDENEDCITVFVIKDGKPDSRKKIVKKLKDKKAVFEFNRLNERELTKYILDEFKKNDFNISMSDANYMANYTGYLEYESTLSLYHVNNEINKIMSHNNDRKSIKTADLDMLMIKSVESNIFRLVDYICENNKRNSFEILDEMLLNNTPEQFIIHMIARQYRMLYRYVILQKKGYSYNEIMNKMKIKNFIASKLAKQSKNLNMSTIEYYMKRFLEIDRKIKTGEIDSRVGLELITNGIIGHIPSKTIS
ncbi:MAG: DNA polymerase III subunit delta [Tissierellia bacterium]|nr:DNA polymerase III subunit delta [Tissierellia bacterium]